VKEVKEIIFWRGRALYLYGTEKDIQRSQRKLRKHLGFLKDDSNNFGEISGTQRNCQKGFSKINEVSMKPQSHFELSQGDLNIVFQLWSNSAKPLWSVPFWIHTQLEISNFLCGVPNEYNESLNASL
jgi:hypothetical protein